MQIKFRITNLTCDACYKISEMALKKLARVSSVNIRSDGFTTVELKEEIPWFQIKEALAAVDKKAELI